MFEDPINEGAQDGDEPKSGIMGWTYPDQTKRAQIQSAKENLSRAEEAFRVAAQRAESTDRTEDHLHAQNAWDACCQLHHAVSVAYMEARFPAMAEEARS